MAPRLERANLMELGMASKHSVKVRLSFKLPFWRLVNGATSEISTGKTL